MVVGKYDLVGQERFLVRICLAFALCGVLNVVAWAVFYPSEDHWLELASTGLAGVSVVFPFFAVGSIYARRPCLLRFYFIFLFCLFLPFRLFYVIYGMNSNNVSFYAPLEITITGFDIAFGWWQIYAGLNLFVLWKVARTFVLLFVSETIIASHTLSLSLYVALPKVFAAFATFDTVRDGDVNASRVATEDVTAVMQALGQNPTMSEVVELLSIVSMDQGQSTLSFGDFCRIEAHYAMLQRRKRRAARHARRAERRGNARSRLIDGEGDLCGEDGVVSPLREENDNAGPLLAGEAVSAANNVRGGGQAQHA